jgi:aryl-alcohol dehydrogenase-like predicted oxidoreductase
MNTRRLGSAQVSAIGLGCMNLSHAYGVPPDRAAAQALLRTAIERGVTHFDTAALYGFGRNEQLVGEALRPFRQQLHLASKCGITGVAGKRLIDGRADTIRRTCEESLQRLQTDVIDLYYLHRWDKAVPIEESVGALSDLVRRGSVRAIGLSEVSAATLRRAHAVHPIAAVQSEYSLWTRNPEVALLDACRELGVSFVAFSPLGRGFLAGGVRDPQALAEQDLRRGMPRFQEPHFSANLRLLSRFAELAAEAGCTTAQLALCWLLRKSADIVPIVGTTSVTHLDEDLAAANLDVPATILDRAQRLINAASVSGARYAPATQAEIDTEEIVVAHPVAHPVGCQQQLCL